jgi:hypothetical protein
VPPRPQRRTATGPGFDGPGSDRPAFDGSSRSGIDVADGYATGLRKLRWAANDNINQSIIFAS